MRPVPLQHSVLVWLKLHSLLLLGVVDFCGAVRRADDQGKTFTKINHGNCRELGMFPIPDQSTCEEAACKLGLADRDAKETVELDTPEGCYYHDNHDLMLNLNPHTQGQGAEMSTYHSPRHPICQSEPHNCQEDLMKFQTDWSWQKKQWCCGHFGLGCEAPEWAKGDLAQILQRNGVWCNCKVIGVTTDGCVEVYVAKYNLERKVQPAMVAAMLRKPGDAPSSPAASVQGDPPSAGESLSEQYGGAPAAAPAPSVVPLTDPAPWYNHPDIDPVERPRPLPDGQGV